MVSGKEREFFERIAIPQVLFSYTDGKTNAVLVSDSLCDLLSVDRRSLIERIDKNPIEFVHPDDAVWMVNLFHRFVEDHSSMDVMFRFVNKQDGGYQLMHGIGLWQPLENGSEVIMFYFDVIKRMQSNIRLIYSSFEKTDPNIMHNDAVTDLPNLRYMRQFANEKLRSFCSCAVEQVIIYIGVKAMRSYNDRYGYERGDDLMLLIAREIPFADVRLKITLLYLMIFWATRMLSVK